MNNCGTRLSEPSYCEIYVKGEAQPRATAPTTVGSKQLLPTRRVDHLDEDARKSLVTRLRWLPLTELPQVLGPDRRSSSLGPASLQMPKSLFDRSHFSAEAH
jgi:hypothetical protein